MSVTRDILGTGPTGLPGELISDLQAAGCVVTRNLRTITAGPNFGEIINASGALDDILAGVGAFKARGRDDTEVVVLDPYFVCGVVPSEQNVYHAVDWQPGQAVNLCHGSPVTVVARRFGLYYSKNCPECQSKVLQR